MTMTIDITPTPEALRHSVQLFETQITKSQRLMDVGEEWLEFVATERGVYSVASEVPIVEAALEALQEQERQRIEHMREGIAVASAATANPSESEQG